MKVNPKSLLNLKSYKPGQSGNLKGRPRKAAGLSVQEQINVLAEKDPTEKKLREIAKSKEAGWTLRTAASRMLRTLEAGDLADFSPYLDGTSSLVELRDDGINTELVKKAKVKTRTFGERGSETIEVEREIELSDRAGADFDRIMDRTIGRAAQQVSMTHDGEVKIVRVQGGERKFQRTK